MSILFALLMVLIATFLVTPQSEVIDGIFSGFNTANANIFLVWIVEGWRLIFAIILYGIALAIAVAGVRGRTQ